MLGLQIPRQSQAVNLGWLLLLRGLGITEANFCLFESIQQVMQLEPRPAIHMGKQLGWASKLGEARVSGDLHGGSNSVREVDGVSVIAPACQLCGG